MFQKSLHNTCTCSVFVRHLQMKLGSPLWKQVQKMPPMWNRLSWPCLLKSRIGTVSYHSSLVPTLLVLFFFPFIDRQVLLFSHLHGMISLSSLGCRMASQPMNNARPPTVQIRGQPVNQKSGCCSSWREEVIVLYNVYLCLPWHVKLVLFLMLWYEEYFVNFLSSVSCSALW